MSFDVSSLKTSSSVIGSSIPSNAIVDLDFTKAAQELEYPPVPLLANSSTVTQGSYGTGIYTVSASTQSTSANVGFGYLAFESGTLSGEADSYWSSSALFNATTGNYIGTVATTSITGTRYNGEWLQISMPQKIRISSLSILPRQDSSNYSPRDFVVLGSNDNTNWNLIYSASSINNWTATQKTFNVTGNTKYYSTYRLVVTRAGNSDTGSGQDSVQIARLRFFGDQESKINAVGTSGLGNFVAPPVTQDGLIAWFDPANPKCYPGTGANLYNLVDGSTATLQGSYNFTNGNIRLNNTSPIANANTSNLQLSTLNISTVSLWYKQESSTASSYFLLDMRTGGTGGWIYSSVPNAGSNWTTGTLYKNGGTAQAITWSNIQTVGAWQNITVIANTSAIDDMTLFSRYTNVEGLDVTFGPIFVYNRVITQEENAFNFNAIRSRYNLDGGYPIYSPIGSGLLAYYDPANPLSYPGTGATMSSLVGNVTATLGGTYNYTSGNIRLANTSGSANTNTSTLQLGSLSSVRTVSLWYYQHSNDAERYLLDGRSGGSGAWIYSSLNIDGTGSNWTSGSLYKNGDSAQTILWSNIETTGRWQNITVVANTPFTDDLTIFGRNNQNSVVANSRGLDVTFGPILIYNRAITQAENEYNFNVFRKRFGLGSEIGNIERPLIQTTGGPNNGSYARLTSSRRANLESNVTTSSLIATNGGFTAAASVKLNNVDLSTTNGVYPPAAMTATTTNITTGSYGKGIYVASRSTFQSGANEAFYAFDKNLTTRLQTSGGKYDNDGVYYTLGQTMPPGPMTSNTISLTGYSAGNGAFTASSSSVTSGSAAYYAFDGNTTNTAWISSDGVYDSSGNYIGSSSVWGTSGEWIQLNYNVNYTPKSITITCNDPSRAPSQFCFYHSSGTHGVLQTAGNWITNPTQTFTTDRYSSTNWSSRNGWGIVVTSIAGTGGALLVDEISMTLIDPITTTDTNSIQHNGEYVQLQMPNSIYLKSFTLTGGTFSPKTFAMLGSTNGSTWDLLYNTATAASLLTSGSTIITNSSNPYNYYRLVAKTVNNNNFCYIRELSFTQQDRPEVPKTILDCTNLTGDQRIRLDQFTNYIHPLDYVQVDGAAPLVITATNGNSFTTGSGSPTFIFDNSQISQTLGKTTLLLTNSHTATTFGNTAGSMLTYQFVVPVTGNYNINLQLLPPNTSSAQIHWALDGVYGGNDLSLSTRLAYSFTQIYTSQNLIAGTHTLVLGGSQPVGFGGFTVVSTDGKYYGYSVNSKNNLGFNIHNGDAVYPRASALYLPPKMVPSGAVVSADPRTLSGFVTGRSVNAVGNFVQNTSGNMPTYTSSGGLSNLPYLSFNRSSSQHLATPGSLTLNIATNGGFTAMALVRFIGSAVSYERIFEFGMGENNNNINLGRLTTTNNLTFELRNGSNVYALSTTNLPILQNTWQVFACRYNRGTNFTEIFVNGRRVISGTSTQTMTDRTLISNFIGRSNWVGLQTANMDFGGLYAYDRCLTDTEMTDLYLNMRAAIQPTLTLSKWNNLGANYSNNSGDINIYNGTQLIRSESAVNVYPPVALTGTSSVFTSTISGALYGNGNYIINGNVNSGGTPALSFNRDLSLSVGWGSGYYDTYGIYYDNNQSVPPVAMTADTITVSNLTVGNGSYTAGSSSVDTGSATYYAFDGSDATAWRSAAGTYDGSGNYTGTNNIFGVLGESLSIAYPSSIYIKTVTIRCLNPAAAPSTFRVYRDTVLATNYTCADWTTNPTQTFIISSAPRSQYGIVITSLQGSAGYAEITNLFFTVIDRDSTTDTVTNIVYPGAFIGLQMPVQISPRSLTIIPTNRRYLVRFVLFGSNDGTTWNLIHNATSSDITWTANTAKTFSTATNNYYNRFRIVLTKVTDSLGAEINEIYFSGIEEITNKTFSSISLGKSVFNSQTNFSDLDIANLRIYDRALTTTDLKTLLNVSNQTVTSVQGDTSVQRKGADKPIVNLDGRALTLSNATGITEWNGFTQGNSSNQPVYYTNDIGGLLLAENPNMNDPTPVGTTFSDVSATYFRKGAFEVKASSIDTGGGGPFHTYLSFADYKYSGSPSPDSKYWMCDRTLYDTSGNYIGSKTTAGVGGEWLQFKYDGRKRLYSYSIACNKAIRSRVPLTWNIYGSNDESSWQLVDTKTVTLDSWALALTTQTFTINNQNEYIYFRFVCTNANANLGYHIWRWRLYTRDDYNKSYINFNNVNSQFLQSPTSLVLNTATNGGFTALALARFNGTTATLNETVFDFGSGQTTDNIVFARAGTTGTMQVTGYNGASLIGTTTGGNLAQDTWNVFSVRHRSSSLLTEIYQNNVIQGTSSWTSAPNNRILTSNYLGRTNDGTSYSNIDIAALRFYDRPLTDRELTDAYNAILAGTPVDLVDETAKFTKTIDLSNAICDIDAQSKLRSLDDPQTTGLVEFPPRAITATQAPVLISDSPYGNGIYHVTASSNFDTTWTAYRAFDKDVTTSNYWQTNTGGSFAYNATTGVYSGTRTTNDINGTTYTGEWLQIQLPNALQLYHFQITPGPNDGTSSTKRAPRNFVLLGSTDCCNWTVVYTATNVTNWTSSAQSFYLTNTNYKFRYYRLVVSRVGNFDSSTSQDFCIIRELQLFGVPQTSDTLIYPPVESSGSNSWTVASTAGNYGIGRYTASSNSVNARYAFESLTWWSSAGGYDGTTGYYTSTVSTTAGSTVYLGDWIQLQTPQAINLTSFTILPRQNSSFSQRSPADFVLLGSNDGTIWTTLGTWTGINWTTAAKSFTLALTISYNRFRLVTTRVGNNDQTTNRTFVNIWRWQLFTANNTPVTTVPRPITNIGEYTQINPEFAPKLISGLQVYPPANMTANTTTITKSRYGNGTYVVSSSTSSFSPYLAFDSNNLFNVNIDNFWASNSVYNGTTGNYTGSVSTTAGSAVYSGEWLQIQMSQKILLKSFSLYPRQTDAQRMPRNFVILGSNDGTSWNLVNTVTDYTSWGNYTYRNYQFTVSNANVYYSYYRMVIQRVGILNVNTSGDQSQVNIARWQLFGFEERDNYLTFNSSKTEFLDGGARTLQIEDNGGLTASALVRFSYSPVANETIFDFGTLGNTTANLYLSRVGTTGNLTFGQYNNTVTTTTTPITSGNWTLISTRYKTSTNRLEIFKDNSLITSATIGSIGNLTCGNAFVGRSMTGVYSNIAVKNLTVLDRFLDNSSLDTLNRKITGEIVSTSSKKILEYPPKALTAYTTNVTGGSYGNGTYIISTSSEWNTSNRSVVKMFNKNFTEDGNAYHSSTIGDFASGGIYRFSTTTTDKNNVSYLGIWMQLQLPKQILLTSFSLYPRYSNARNARDFVLLGSNDGITWTTLLTKTEQTSWSTMGIPNNYNVQSNQSFSYYRLVVQKITGDSILNMEELIFYGYEPSQNLSSVTGRYVKLAKRSATLSVPEIAVYDTNNSLISLNKTVTSSSIQNTDGSYNTPAFAADGNYMSTAMKRSVMYPSIPMIANTSVATSSSANYGLGLYTAQASSLSIGSAWNAFDESAATTITTATGSSFIYDTSTGSYSGSTITYDKLTKSYTGEWLQITLPELIYPTGVQITPNSTTWATSSPTNVTLLASTNSLDWEPIITNNTLVWSTSGSQTVNVNGTSGSLTAYDNYRLISNSINSTTSLEYPPVAMTADTTNITSASYGNGTYIASRSDGAQSAFGSFNKSTGENVFLSDYDSTTGNYIGSVSTVDIATSTTTYGGYIQLQLPLSIKLDSFNIQRRYDSDRPTQWTVFGSTDGSLWTSIYTRSLDASTNQTDTVSSNISYNYYRFVFTKKGVVIGNQTSNVNPTEIRLYSRDLYGLMSIQDVKILGGTNYGQSTALEFPPIDLTSISSNITSGNYGNGTYTISASANTTGTGGTNDARLAFESTTLFGGYDSFWSSQPGSNDYAISGSYIGSVSTTVGSTDIAGSWLQISLPRAIVLDNIELKPRFGYPFRAPKNFTIVGSNDGVTWTSVYTVSNVTSWSNENFPKDFIINSTRAYSYYRLIVQSVVGNNASTGECNISRWRLYGRELQQAATNADANAFVQVDLGADYPIAKVLVHNATENQSNLQGTYLTITDSSSREVLNRTINTANQTYEIVDLTRTDALVRTTTAYQEVYAGHNDITYAFDNYYDDTYKTDIKIGSSYQMAKTGDQFKLRTGTTVTNSDLETFTDSLALNTSGSLTLGNGGTQTAVLLEGIQSVGTGTAGINTTTVTLPVTLANTNYKVIALANTTSASETYAITVTNKTTTTFDIKICRSDSIGASWDSTLTINWYLIN